MQIAKNKKIALFIAIFLTISIAASSILVPSVTARNPPYEITTYAKVQALPDPIGVGQSALVYAFLANAPLSGSAIVNTYRFHNFEILVTDPTGHTERYFYETVEDTTGCQFFRFTPTMVGVYNITFNYQGQTLAYPRDVSSATSAAIGDKYMPSTAVDFLTVQEDPVKTFPDSYPLPAEYWTRPIYGENQLWYTISSDWFGAGTPVVSSVSSGTITQISTGGSMQQRFPGDAIGSMTSHVMWTKPMQEGGVVGGNRFEILGDTYFEGSAYNNRYQNPIIMYGRIFYREPVGLTGTGSGASLCVDLRTGEEIWRRTDLPTFSFGWSWNVQSPNQHGVYPAYLCTSNMAQVYDMWTGQIVFNVTNYSSVGGTLVQGPVGEYIRYTFFNNGTTAAPNWYLCAWNSSRMFSGTGYATGTGNTLQPDTTTLTTGGSAVDARRGLRYSWLNPTTQNQSIPWRNTFSGSFSVVTAHFGDIMICRNGTYPSLTGVTYNNSGQVGYNTTRWQYFAINLNASKGELGSILWWSPIYESRYDKTITYGGADPVARVFIEVEKETYNMIGYSYANGAKLWETNEVNDILQTDIAPLDYFGNPAYPYVATNVAYGKIYSLSYGGILFCYDLADGKMLWTNGNGGVPGNNTDTGTSTPGPHPAFVNGIGNGMIYTVATQHTTITPISKGQMNRCINATSGLEVWAISAYVGEFFSTSFAMADGYCNWYNGYDNQLYTVGRGPSTLTVSAPDLAAASGQPVVIKGTIYDISAGSQQNEQAARFPNGIPLAADSAMTDWMGYVYQQKPLPDSFEGVNVEVSVIDANGNFRSIGTAVTDATGQYNLIWTPDISGNYQVVATFAGTYGYWPSTATTAFSVMEPIATATPQPTEPPSMSDLYFVPAIAGLFVFVAIIGVVIILVLRKRP